MDNTIRVTDLEVSAHLAEVHTQIEELINRQPEGRRRKQSRQERCRELILHGSSYGFEEEGHDGQSDIELTLHRDPMLGQALKSTDDRRRCSDPYVLLELTRTAISVNGPARSVETYRIMISWMVVCAHSAHKNLTLKILRETSTKTKGLPTATSRRYKWSEGKTSDNTVQVTLDELTEATDEIIAILSDHTPS